MIRPNDLLLGRASADKSIIPNVERLYDDLPAKRRAYIELLRQKESVINSFWQKWYKLVFPTLISSSKWHRNDREVSVGDICLIRDTNPIRNDWSWGEVTDVSPSSDGKVRRATLRYKCGKKSKFVCKSVRDLAVYSYTNK